VQREAPRDDERRGGGSRLESALRLAWIQYFGAALKRAVGEERLREISTFSRPVLVADHGRNPVDVEVDRVTENDEL
jgi:hypothetical protein